MQLSLSTKITNWNKLKMKNEWKLFRYIYFLNKNEWKYKITKNLTKI